MHLTEFSANRAERLNKTALPETELPLDMKILWIETVDKQRLTESVVKQSHQHTFYEIHFIFCGNISYESNNNFYKLSEGQAIIIPAFENHRYISCSKDILKTAIAFSGDNAFLKNLTTTLTDFEKSVYENFNYILAKTDKEDIFTPHIISGRAIEILYSVLKKLIDNIPQSDNNSHDPRFLVAKAFIDNNKYKNISCKEVANECCLSTKQLNRIFKTETEKSVSEYINHIKIKFAKKLLTDNSLSVKEICFNLGFENESSFISFFKRHSGLTPGIYRKQMSEK